jgi:hypothetical protein
MTSSEFSKDGFANTDLFLMFCRINSLLSFRKIALFNVLNSSIVLKLVVVPFKKRTECAGYKDSSTGRSKLEADKFNAVGSFVGNDLTLTVPYIGFELESSLNWSNLRFDNFWKNDASTKDFKGVYFNDVDSDMSCGLQGRWWLCKRGQFFGG